MKTEAFENGAEKLLTIPIVNYAIPLFLSAFSGFLLWTIAKMYQKVCVQASNDLINGPSLTSFTIYMLNSTVPPFVTVHPESKMRMSGQSVTFCCEGEGNPPPEIEWYETKIFGPKIEKKKIS